MSEVTYGFFIRLCLPINSWLFMLLAVVFIAVIRTSMYGVIVFIFYYNFSGVNFPPMFARKTSANVEYFNLSRSYFVRVKVS